MSNKHWCMPNYPFLRYALRHHPALKNEKPHMALYKFADLLISAGKSPHETEPYTAEASLLYKDSPCLFIESKELCSFLHESTYSEGIFKTAVKDFDYKFLCFPRMNIAGKDTRSCAFGRFGGVKSEIRDPDIALFTCALPNGIDARSWPVHEFDNYLIDKPSDNPRFSEDDLAHFMLRLCMAAVVYSVAFPDYIRDGLPVDVKAPEISKPRILRAAPEILEGATRTSVSMHIRAGHFKTLRHERFRRDEEGKPRIICVRQTVVAGKLTPKTAVEP